MCILFIAVEEHEDYPLIIAANRDEFFNRETQTSRFWTERPELLAGKDLVAGGTWMGVNKSGYLSALTNIRNPNKLKSDAQSRGELVLNYLNNKPLKEDYLKELHNTQHNYNGYNLLFGHWKNLWVYNNHNDQCQVLTKGFHGLSNADLNSPWPKINRGVANLQDYCHSKGHLKDNVLFDLLMDDSLAEDHLLPITGAPVEWEKKLSCVFIRGEEYGTRSSTLLLVDNDNNLHWHEKTFNTDAICTGEFETNFTIE